MDKTKTSYRTLRICSRILSSIGILTFLIALAGLILIVIILKVNNEYISNTQQMGLLAYTIVLGAIFYFCGATIPVICDIADNMKLLASKDCGSPAFKEKEEIDHSKYLPKTDR